VRHRKHSDKRLDERLEEDTEQDEPRGILEIFPPREVLRTSRGPREVDRDEDAPLAREPEDDDAD
jgi:hypothetical protein